MVITLNSDPLDVTIENEKTLDELISGLTKWLNKSGYEITGIVQDGLELELYNGKWSNTLLDTIEELDIKAISGYDKYISDLQTLYQYITLLHNSIKTGNKSLTEDLLSELPFIKSSLDYFFAKENQTAFETQQLQQLIDNSDEQNNDQSLLSVLQDITLILQNRIKEVTSPFIELHTSAEKLKDLLPGISDVSVMLQTGDDRQAMDSVLKFIELSEKLIRIFPFLKEFGYTDITKESIDKENFDDFYKGFNGILKELVDAFAINDPILIGDLMEYEIVPRVSKLLEFINLIEKVQE